MHTIVSLDCVRFYDRCFGRRVWRVHTIYVIYVLCAVYATFYCARVAVSHAAASHRKSKTTRNMNQNNSDREGSLSLSGLLLSLHLVDAICRRIPIIKIGDRLCKF